MTEIGAHPGRISELSREHLDALAEKLDERARAGTPVDGESMGAESAGGD